MRTHMTSRTLHAVMHACTFRWRIKKNSTTGAIETDEKGEPVLESNTRYVCGI
jgi:hypothetical protein